uniref:Kazal-like domain-containing protein n=1 Tax=Thermodesulfobacterium geofontis TaxID=1295609 RepID=A0A7C4NTN2_9BACT
MKKLVNTFIFSLLLVSVVLAEDYQSNKDRESTKKCEKVCVQWEERRDCRPDPVFPDRQICALYKVCTKYEERCREEK